MRSFLSATLVALISLALTGCGNYVLSPSSTDCQPEWDSGNESNLSPPQSCSCPPTQGKITLLTGLKVTREPQGNLDNFVARLETECSSYPILLADDASWRAERNGNTVSCEVFSANHDPERSFWTRIPWNNVPVGVQININRNAIHSNRYLRDIRLIYTDAYERGGRLQSSGNLLYSTYENPPALGGGTGETTNILCLAPGFNFLSGISLRYSLNNGKVRQLSLQYTHIELIETEENDRRIAATPLPEQVFDLENLSDNTSLLSFPPE